MRLIPPQTTDTVDTGVDTATSAVVLTLTPDMQARVEALELLNNAGQVFSATLEQAIKRITSAEIFNSALSLAAFLMGGADMLNSIVTNNGQGIPEKFSVHTLGGASGYTTGHRAAGSGSGTTRKRRGRPPGSGKKNLDAIGAPDSGPRKKRGRGRPKGSKNKATLLREARSASVGREDARNASASRPAARRKPRKAVRRAKPGRPRTQRSKPVKRVVRVVKAVTRKTVARKAVRKPRKPTTAHSRQRRGSSRRKGTPEAPPIATAGTEGTV
jgi:hypothetical protein